MAYETGLEGASNRVRKRLGRGKQTKQREQHRPKPRGLQRQSDCRDHGSSHEGSEGEVRREGRHWTVDASNAQLSNFLSTLRHWGALAGL